MTEFLLGTITSHTRTCARVHTHTYTEWGRAIPGFVPLLQKEYGMHTFPSALLLIH